MAKILIIDDEEQLRKLLARIIALEGYEVAEAADCAGGRRMLRRYEPDVVLCDVKLPDGNGVEMVGRIKEAAPATEVILLTAYGNIPDGVQAIKNGAFDFLPKPLDDEKLLASVEKAIALDWERRSHHTSHTAAMKGLATLTPRGREVAGLVAEGLLNKVSAERLGIAEKTVQIHRGQVCRKLKVRSAVEISRILDQAEGR